MLGYKNYNDNQYQADHINVGGMRRRIWLQAGNLEAESLPERGAAQRYLSTWIPQINQNKNALFLRKGHISSIKSYKEYLNPLNLIIKHEMC